MNNHFPKTGSKRNEIEDWLVGNGHLQEQDTTTKKKTKREILKIVNELNLKPVYTTYRIVAEYNYRIKIAPHSTSPPYHCELQPIEKVWSMVKKTHCL
ncbi:hypothetical protein EDC96DRAFT_160908 [Choanephora cucurbitarum]|nr:hypothetical protein EDC96DRAFT_160908 [Choanephora cucurbitarum]